MIKSHYFRALIVGVFAVAAFVGLAGGSWGGLASPAFAAPPAASSPPADAAPSLSADDYRLGPGDEVRITVYGEKDLTGQFFVAASGKLSFPLVGDIEAAGNTIKEIDSILAAKLSDGYLVDPKVSGEVLNFRPYYILGEVNKPGQYPYTNGLTAVKAVATAQGYTYRANTKRIFIRHANEDKEHEYSLSSEIYIQPGDTMRVGERYF